MRFYREMEKAREMKEAIESKLSSLKSKLESLSCSSSELSLRKNYSIEKSGMSEKSEKSETHVLRVSVTDRINGNKATFYIYFAEKGDSIKGRIENQYSYLYESFDRRNYALEQLLECIVNDWCSTYFNDAACER
jgi:hypothetical protein